MTVFLFRCPNGHLGRIDGEQKDGDVSIVCTECEFHGYVDDGEVVPPTTDTDRSEGGDR